MKKKTKESISITSKREAKPISSFTDYSIGLLGETELNQKAMNFGKGNQNLGTYDGRNRERERTSTTLSSKQMQILSSTFFRRMEEDTAIFKEFKKSLRDEVEA